jgi:hypothetical protein
MRLRAVFDEEADAQAVARRLRSDGFEVSVQRDRFAGEDDDEDHAWAVVTDAPEYVLEVLVEEHAGWLDHDAGPACPSPAAPLDLPDAPRRVKGHWPTD